MIFSITILILGFIMCLSLSLFFISATLNLSLAFISRVIVFIANAWSLIRARPISSSGVSSILHV